MRARRLIDPDGSIVWRNVVTVAKFAVVLMSLKSVGLGLLALPATSTTQTNDYGTAMEK